MTISPTELAKIALAGVVSSRDKERLDRIILQLDDKHFMDKAQRNMFGILRLFYQRYSEVPSREAMEILMSKREPAQGQLYLELFDSLGSQDINDGEFRLAIDELKDLAAEKATEEALVMAREVLKKGVRTEKGEILQGHNDARLVVIDRLAEVDKELGRQFSPGGDTRLEYQDIINEYMDKKTNKVDRGIFFGIPDIDQLTGGVHNGELVITAGYSSVGKSHIGVQLAHHAAIMQGKSVVYFTSETVRNTIRRRLLARHSRMAMFELPEGLDSNKIKDSSLSPAEEEMFHAVVEDYTSNSEYGPIIVEQFPKDATFSYIDAGLARYSRDRPLDLCIIDPIYWLKPSRGRASLREELVSVVQEGKQTSISYHDGRGIPIVTPWQVNRTSWELAVKSGYYTSAALNETAESTQSADTILTILNLDEVPEGRYAELKGQVVKQRDGATGHGIDIKVDYATSYFSQDVTRFNNRSASSSPSPVDLLMG